MSLWKDVQNVDESKKDHNQTVGEAVSAVLEQESVAEETTSQAVGAPSLSAQILEQEVDSRSPTSLAEAEIQIQSPHRENLHEDDEARTPELKPAWLHGPSMEGIHDQDRQMVPYSPSAIEEQELPQNFGPTTPADGHGLEAEERDKKLKGLEAEEREKNLKGLEPISESPKSNPNEEEIQPNLPESVTQSPSRSRSRSLPLLSRPAAAVRRRPAAAVMRRPAARAVPVQDPRMRLENGLWVGCSKCRWRGCTRCRERAAAC